MQQGQGLPLSRNIQHSGQHPLAPSWFPEPGCASPEPRPQTSALQRCDRDLHQQPLPRYLPASFGSWRSCLGRWTLPWTLMSSQDCCAATLTRPASAHRKGQIPQRTCFCRLCPHAELRRGWPGHVSR